MPELPDLQIISQNLDKIFSGECLDRILIHNSKKLTTPQDEFSQAFNGETLISVNRDGKELVLTFTNGNTLVLHLMREGKLTIENDGSARHKIIELLFKSGKYLAMMDFMKQATAGINPQPIDTPDALSISFTCEYLSLQLGKKPTSTIKAFLVDQTNIRGIGNAYADEILWESRIAPHSKCGKLPTSATETLYKKIKDVLDNASAQIKGRNPDIISGEIRDFLIVHRKDLSYTPSGAEIINEKIGGKSTYYTKEQILYE